jgi:hypothetical protein
MSMRLGALSIHINSAMCKNQRMTTTLYSGKAYRALASIELIILTFKQPADDGTHH